MSLCQCHSCTYYDDFIEFLKHDRVLENDFYKYAIKLTFIHNELKDYEGTRYFQQRQLEVLQRYFIMTDSVIKIPNYLKF